VHRFLTRIRQKTSNQSRLEEVRVWDSGLIADGMEEDSILKNRHQFTILTAIFHGQQPE
jgi:hypothetical protein